MMEVCIEGSNQSNSHTFRSALLAVRLHGDMGIEMVQCAICLLASVPSALVHPLDLFVSATRTLVLLSTGDWDEGVDLDRRIKSAKHALEWFMGNCFHVASSASRLLEAIRHATPRHPRNATLSRYKKCLLGQDARQMVPQMSVFGHHSQMKDILRRPWDGVVDRHSQPSQVAVACT